METLTIKTHCQMITLEKDSLVITREIMANKDGVILVKANNIIQKIPIYRCKPTGMVGYPIDFFIDFTIELIFHAITRGYEHINLTKTHEWLWNKVNSSSSTLLIEDLVRRYLQDKTQ